MKLTLIILLLVVGCSSAFAQKLPSHATGVLDSQGRMIYRFVERLPFAYYDVSTYISKKLKYPDSARKANVQGVVNVGFFIDTKGRIQGVKIKSEERLGYGLEEEAMRVIQSLPRWVPGRQNGRKVNVYYTIPIGFTLE
ncbi:MAG: energy transducer TonB [Sphingobacteriales bacterium]|nr:MAG: energy transducer TonB [Sphingobacteriales bacterium]